MKTKFFIVFAALALSAGQLCALQVKIDGINYNLNETNLTAEVANHYSSFLKDTLIILASVEYKSKTYSVTSIGESAFYQCTGLTSVTIPNSVTSIGESAFRKDTLRVDYTGNLTDWCDIEFKKSWTKNFRLYINQVEVTDLVIPEGVQNIRNYAFQFCVSLKSVTISNSVTRIGYQAFSDCSGLTSVTISASVMSIGDYAFSNCTGLTSVTIPNSVTRIGSSAFSGCSGLTSVILPDSLTSIGSGAFYNCTGLTSVTIPNSETNIGGGAFYNTAWYNHFTNGPVYIGKSFYAYKGTMPANTSFTIDAGTLQICGSAFYNCTGLTSVTIPNSVTSIGSSAFYNCSGLTSVTISASVTLIEIGVFSGCSGLTSVTIPASVTSIEDIAFSDCSGLTSVTIPASVTHIGEAFSGCTGLTFVTCYAETPPITDFYYRPPFSRQDTLRVPYKSIEAYRTDASWGNFKVIQGIGATLIDNVEEVTVKADTTTALFCWPALATATHYVLEVYTDSSNMRSFTFGVSGEMITAKMSWTEIEEMVAQHLGYTYTVTGLTPETRYYYRLESKDDSGRVWDSKSGTFTTKSSMGLTIKTAPLVGVFARAGKIVVEGYAQCDVSVYDLTGRLVTQRTNVTNCTLEVPKGTYIVKKGKEVGKVIVP